MAINSIDSSKRTRLVPQNFIDGEHSYTTISEILAGVVLNPKPPTVWFVATGLGFAVLNVMLLAVTYLVLTGTGVWGNNQPTAWAWDIINFVCWNRSRRYVDFSDSPPDASVVEKLDQPIC